MCAVAPGLVSMRQSEQIDDPYELAGGAIPGAGDGPRIEVLCAVLG